jgi:amino acid transporter
MATTIAFIVGIMLSPRTLALSGNLVGHLGAGFPGWILFALFGHFLTVLLYRAASGPSAGGRTKVGALVNAFGRIPALALVLGPRILFTITASVSILAIAGYVFNEVFVYWFPNLGFSFLLLGCFLVLNCLGMKIAGKVQVFLVAISLLALIALVVSGIVIDAGRPAESPSNPLSGRELLLAGSASFLLLVGFDLAEFLRRFQRRSSESLFPSMVGGLLIVAALLFSWGWVSVKFVPLDRLSETTVPAMVTARAILGQSGRVLMGIVLMAASAGSVNGLLIGTSNLISETARQNHLPSVFKRSFGQVKLPLILLVLGVAGLLYLGMAGKPVLEVFIRTGLCLWLLYYAALHLCVLLTRNFNLFDQSGRRSGMVLVVPILGVVIFFMAFFVQVVYVYFT